VRALYLAWEELLELLDTVGCFLDRQEMREFPNK